MNIETEKFVIEESFNISGRGVAVVLNEITKLNVSKEYQAEILKPDGTLIKVTAFKEWLLRRNLTPPEIEAFMLTGIKNEEITNGTTIKFYG
jgi:hypothetical protein